MGPPRHDILSYVLWACRRLDEIDGWGDDAPPRFVRFWQEYQDEQAEDAQREKDKAAAKKKLKAANLTRDEKELLGIKD